MKIDRIEILDYKFKITKFKNTAQNYFKLKIKTFNN